MRLCGSELERRWLEFLDQNDLNLPSHAQKFVEACKTRPDFLYDNRGVAIYIDGPIHQYPDRQERDQQQTECMEDIGYTVIRFPAENSWSAIIEKYPNLFGRLR